MLDLAQIDYQALIFPYVRSPDQDAPTPVRHPVVVVGAGAVGLTTAIDLARQGTRVAPTSGTSSRAPRTASQVSEADRASTTGRPFGRRRAQQAQKAAGDRGQQRGPDPIGQ